MNKNMHPLAGIYVAAVTPLTEQDELDLSSLAQLMRFYAERGCHGVLLLGTTGEGTSMSAEERIAFWQAAVLARNDFPDFRLLAATGTPSLSESAALTEQAFSDGIDAVVVLPPYYFRNASEEGLYDWYARLIDQSVPRDKYLLGYHIPQVSGVALTANLLARLNRDFPARFAGMKDSSGDLTHAKEMVSLLPGKAILVGNDKLLGPALSLGASGAITALANLRSPLLREIWESHLEGQSTKALQADLTRSREVLDQHPSAQSFLKATLSTLHGFPNWPVRAPLQSFGPEKIAEVTRLFKASLDE